MKAGIYKTPNGNYVYVAKDRTIMATTLDPSTWPGNKVRTSERELKAHFFDVTAVRVSDVPNGTTDHAAALMAYVERHGVLRDAKTGKALGRLVGPFKFRTTEAEAALDRLAYGESFQVVNRSPAEATVVIDIESGEYADFAKHLKAGGSERMLCMPPALGVGYGPLAQSAQDIREASVGVPPHVALKMVDAYCEKYPHLRALVENPTVVIREKCAPLVIGHKTLLSAEHDNDGKPFDVDSVKQTLSTIVDYEHAKKDLQVLLHLEQLGVVKWVGHDWEVFDINTYNSTMANPPKILPVLPRGYMEERAAAYVRNRPFVSSAKHATFRPSQLPVFDGPCSSAYTKNYNQKQRAAVSTKFEQLQCQMFASIRESHEQMAKAFFAEALGIVEVVQDEVIVLDCARWNSLEADVREGRYEVMRAPGVMDIRDTSTGTVYAVSPYKAEFIAASSGLRVDGTMEEPAVLRTKSLTVCITGKTMPAAAKRHGATGAVATSESEHEQLLRLANGEIRLIGKQSKRKHRRAGHRVFWCAPLNSWAWEVRS